MKAFVTKLMALACIELTTNFHEQGTLVTRPNQCEFDKMMMISQATTDKVKFYFLLVVPSAIKQGKNSRQILNKPDGKNVKK